MKQKKFLPMLTILLMALLLGACIPGFRPTSAVSVADLEATVAAQTVQARMTEVVVQSLIAQLTSVAVQQQATVTPQEPTQTQVPPTATPLPPTETATVSMPTHTSIPPTATNTPSICYWAQFIKDVTIPDGSDITAGTAFTKTWRLKNIGTCTWTTDFDLVFVSGDAMGAPAVVDLTAAVAPGSTVDLSVQMTAPAKAGSYTGNWQLRSSNGVVFGLGPSQNKSFWVQIDVPSDQATIDPAKPLDFAASYQSATWATSKGTPATSDNYVNGSIYRTDKPNMEKDHTDDEPALIMIPSDGSGGTIYGVYPEVNVLAGDRLTGIIGCTGSSTDCNVMFQINYSADGGATQNLGSWTETYDGNWTYLNIDLSSLAGKKVKFTLVVNNNGSSKDDRVFWLAPKMVR